MAKRLTVEDVNERLAERGLVMLDKEYNGRNSSITVRCVNGHERKMQAASLLNINKIQRTAPCPMCKPQVRRGRPPARRNKVVWIEYYTGHSWLMTQVPDTMTTTELTEQYGRNNWRLAK